MKESIIEKPLCRACNGSGEGYYTTNDKCLACNGKGIEEMEMHTQPETALEHYWFDLGHNSNKIAEENNHLREKLKLSIECLMFYADRKNWHMDSYKDEYKKIIDFSDVGTKSFNEVTEYATGSGGRRARETLEKIN